MEIQLDGHLVATTMRTPGDDYELAVGFLHAGGLLDGAPVQGVRYCAAGSALASGFNVVTVETGGQAQAPLSRLSTSACGLSGATTVEQLASRLRPITGSTAFPLELLAGIPERMADEQGLFEMTGAVHGAVAFDRQGEPVVVREDVSRHNAVDKVVGRLLLDQRVPAFELGLYVSSRASFEIVQKAWAAGLGTIVAAGAPTALSVDAARAANITMVGSVGDGHLHVYSPA